MSHHIHIFGASGSGTSTLGRRLADQIGAKFLDTDWYYWKATDPPFIEKRSSLERVANIERDIEGVSDWILSGSMCGWGDSLLHRLTLAVFLYLDADTRMSRLDRRERNRYGSRIVRGGDMYSTHLAFMEWARSYDHAKAPTRSRDLHEKWINRLRCPVIRLNSEVSLETLCILIQDSLRL